MPRKTARDKRERRSLPRYTGAGISAYVRPKGSFSRLSAEIIDFNRYGAAIRVNQPLPAEQVVYLSLRHGTTQLQRIIGVVHNCVNFDSSFRCGIRFRTESEQQFDRVMIQGQLGQSGSAALRRRESRRGLSSR